MSDAAKFERQLEKLLSDGAETSKIAAGVEKILSVSPKNIFALRCKIVYLLHQNKHAAALTVLEQLAAADPSLRDASQDYAFQKAYCLYRALDYSQAKAVLARARHTAEDVPSRHLLAQLHYHLEEYTEAAAIYESLLSTKSYRDDQERTELLTNYSAACAAVDLHRTATIVREADEKTADLLYNAATAQIEAKDYIAALATLQQAESLCARAHPKSRLRSFDDARSKSSEELHVILDTPKTPEREFFNDVANIWVQMAFVHYATQKEEEAAAILSVLLRHRPSSSVTLAVASINWAAIQHHRDFFDTHRKLRASQNDKVSSRLTSKQRLLVRYNTAMLLLQMGNLNSFKRQVELMENEYPDSDLTHSLKLALVVRESKKRRQPDDKTVQEYIKRIQSNEGVASASHQAQQATSLQGVSSVGKLLPLIASQVFLESGDLESAIAYLSSASEDIRRKPCTVITLVTWKVQVDDIKGAKELLIDTAKALGGPQSNKTNLLKSILVWSAHFFASRGLHADAVEVIRAMQHVTPALQSDREVIALLALALSHHDVDAAQRCMDRVADTAACATPNLSVSAMEELEQRRPSRQTIEAIGFHRPSAEDGAMERADKPRRSRRRPMRRPPRNSEGRIDPERWIPMSVRSYIKDLPERRKRELKRLRAIEQEQKRHIAERRRAAEATGEAQSV